MTRLGAERCRDEGLNKKVGNSHVVATGTVEKCQGIRAGSYPCTVKVGCHGYVVLCCCLLVLEFS